MPSAQQYRDNQRLGVYDERAGNEVAPGYQRGHGEARQDLPAISNTVTTLEKPPFIGRFSAFSLMEKSGCRYEWRRERNWDRTFSA
jgi:hypothetical protein